jgi:uncharacterized protein (DUF427 family)
MTMTVGSGPFGHRPAGRFNFEPPREGMQYIEPFPRRVRALVGDEVVVDSLGVRMLHRQHQLPVWVFPPEDVRTEALDDDDTWVHEDGLAAGLIGIRWDAAERWLEEDEEVIVHPRDPYHRVEVRESSRQVTISLDGETLAESEHPIALFETGLPTRWYLAPDDVRAEISPNRDVLTGCAYKGWASYWDVTVGDRTEPFLAWTYEDPLHEVDRVKGRICFFNERVDLAVDGEVEERPRTAWSGTDWVDSAH